MDSHKGGCVLNSIELSDQYSQLSPQHSSHTSVSDKAGAQDKDGGSTPPLSLSSLTCEPCLFCGTMLQDSDSKKRCKTQASIREFVLEYCRPTAFIYPVFVNLRGGRRLPLCIACVNWQRRCCKGQRKRCNGKKPMLLLDHFVAFMLEPGKVMVPDQRCALRLVKALLSCLDSSQSSWGGPLPLMPVQVQVMVSRLPRDISGETLLGQLVKAWWDFNGNSVFFAHNLTAKLVRKMIKGGEHGEGGCGSNRL